MEKAHRYVFPERTWTPTNSLPFLSLGAFTVVGSTPHYRGSRAFSDYSHEGLLGFGVHFEASRNREEGPEFQDVCGRFAGGTCEHLHHQEQHVSSEEPHREGDSRKGTRRERPE